MSPKPSTLSLTGTRCEACGDPLVGDWFLCEDEHTGDRFGLCEACGAEVLSTIDDNEDPARD